MVAEGPGSVFSELPELLASGADEEMYWEKVASLARELFTCDHVAVYLMEDQKLREVVNDQNIDIELTVDIRRWAQREARRCFRKGEPIRVARDTAVPDGAQELTALFVPIKGHGVIQITSTRHDSFDEATQGELQVFTGYAAHRLSENTQFTDPPGARENGDTLCPSFRPLDKHHSIGVITIDEHGAIRYVNEGVTNLLGYDPDELIANDITTIIPARLKEDHNTGFRAYLLTGDHRLQWRDMKFPVLHSDGEEVSVLISLSEMSGSHEQLFTAIIREESQADGPDGDSTQVAHDLRTIVRASPDPIVSVNREGVIELWNPAAEEVLGYTEEEMIGQKLVETPLIPPGETEEVSDGLVDVFEGNIISGVEVKRKTRSGKLLDIRLSVAPRHNESGEIVGTVAVLKDITDTKERERRLDATRRRYETLFNTAPDAIFVADADTGEILEANLRAAEMVGRSLDELSGIHQTHLHPEEHADAYRELFTEFVEKDRGRVREFQDGSPLYLTTTNGERIPIEISTGVVTLNDRRVIYGVFRDIREQLEFERTLSHLQESTRALFDAGTRYEVAEQVVSTALEVLDFNGAAVFEFEEADGVLRPIAHEPPADIENLADYPPVFTPGESIAWEVFCEGDVVAFDDVRTAEKVYNPDTPVRSEIILPLGEHGVLIIGDTDVAAFGRKDVDLASILASTGAAAMDRTRREEELWTRQRILEDRTDQLEHLEIINDKIRTITRSCVQAETRREIEEAVCAQLAESSSIAFAWIGEVDPIEDSVTPRCKHGDSKGYLEAVSFVVDDEGPVEPAVDAAVNEESVIVGNTPSNITSSTWRREAVRRELRSVMALPLMYQGTLRGVLTVYGTEPNVFSGPIRSALDDMANLVANTIVAMERKQALLANRVTELAFEIRDQSCFLLRFASECDCELSLEQLIPRRDGSLDVFVRVDEGNPKELRERASRSSAIDEATILDRTEESWIQLQFVKPFIASRLADHGITVTDIVAREDTCQVTVAISPAHPTREAVATVTRFYEAEFISKRDNQELTSRELGSPVNIMASLTDRQREVLELAYASGYFEVPREISGNDLAENLDLSSSAFHRHIRTAERAIFRTLFQLSPPHEHRNDSQIG